MLGTIKNEKFCENFTLNHPLGAWCRKPMKKGQKFGPFAGKISRNVSAEMDGNYVWEVSNNVLVFYLSIYVPVKSVSH